MSAKSAISARSPVIFCRFLAVDVKSFIFLGEARETRAEMCELSELSELSELGLAPFPPDERASR